MNKSALLGLLCALALPSAAQTVWRCGADGRTFSDRPCADAQALPLAGTQPSPQDVHEAREVVARERQALQSLAQQRRAREADGRRQGAAGIRRTAPEPSPARATDRPFKALSPAAAS